jgi:AraC-like DNA-binding protein
MTYCFVPYSKFKEERGDNKQSGSIAEAHERRHAMEERVVRPETPVRAKESYEESYSVKDIAEKLNMKERTVYAFCNRTTEFKVKRIGRILRINKRSFDEWWNG